MGDPTIGQVFTLTCTARLMEGETGTLDVQWMGVGVSVDGVTIDPDVEINSTTRALTFDPVDESHGGHYTCLATLNGDMDSSAMYTVTVKSKCIAYIG